MAAVDVKSAVEEYVRGKQVDSFFKQMILGCIHSRAEDPARYVQQFLLEHHSEMVQQMVLPNDTAATQQQPPSSAEEVQQVVLPNGIGTPPQQPPSSAEEELGVEEGTVVTVQHNLTSCADYLNNTLAIGALFECLADRLVEAQPADPMEYLVQVVQEIRVSERSGNDTSHSMDNYGSSTKHAQGDENSFVEDEDEEMMDEEDDIVGDLVNQERMQRARVRRPSVSAECSIHSLQRDSSSGTEICSSTTHEKSDEDVARITSIIGSNILFKDLDSALLRKLVDAVAPMYFTAGTTIIRQGDEGDNFYIVDEGECEVFVLKSSDMIPTRILLATPGVSFGELALMYNSPRAATVKAKSDVKLWVIDRATFRAVVMDTSQKQRALYEGFLQSVPLLTNLSANERARIADVLEPKIFQKHEVIIKEGTPGDDMFVVEEGAVEAFIVDPASGREHVLKKYGAGDFFGELSLLTNKPRAASVRATAVSKCVSIDRKCFNRLMGPCEAIIQRNVDSYKNVMLNIMDAKV